MIDKAMAGALPSFRDRPWLIAVAILVIALGLGLGYALTSDSADTVIAFAAWAALIGAVMLDPLLGLLLWVVLSPYAPFIHLNLSLGAGIPDLSWDRMAAGLFSIALVADVARRKRRLTPWVLMDAALALYILALMISSRNAWRGTSSAVQSTFDFYLVPLLVYVVAKNLVRDRHAVRRVLVALFLIAGYLVLLTANEHITGGELFVIYGRTTIYTRDLQRVNSLLQNPAYIALALNLILPFVLRGAIVSTSRNARRLYGLGVVVLLVTVFSLYNRAGMLGALVVLIVGAASNRRIRFWLIGALALSTPVVALSWGRLSETVLVSERLVYDLSVGYRITAMQAVFQLVSSNLLLGVGFGNFAKLSLSRGLIESYTLNYWIPTTHNSFMDVLSSTGLSGFVPYVLAYLLLAGDNLRLLRQSRENPRIDRSLVVAFWGSFAAYALTLATLDIASAPFCAMIFWLIVGSIQGSMRWTDAGAETAIEGGAD